MYVYIRSRSEPLWVVGFYTPDGKWEPESDHVSAHEASKHVHWLNGGNDAELEGLRKRIEELEEGLTIGIDDFDDNPNEGLTETFRR